MGLLNWITQGSDDYNAAGYQDDAGYQNPYEQVLTYLPMTEAYWRNLGYQGPLEHDAVKQWMQANGLQMANSGLNAPVNENAILGPKGVVPGSNYSTDDTGDFMRDAALVAAGGYFGGGALSNAYGAGAATGGAAGSGAGGLTSAEAAAMMGNGSTAGGGLGQFGTIAAGSGQVAPLALSGAEAAPLIASVPSAAGPTAGGLLTLENAATASSLANAADGSDATADPYGPGSNYGQDTLPAMGLPDDTGSGINWGGMPSAVMDWMRANPAAGRLLMGGLVAGASAGGGGSSGGGYTDSGYRPTVSRGGWSPTATPTQTQAPQRGLITMPTAPGYENSGLWRYGLLGGG